MPDMIYRQLQSQYGEAFYLLDSARFKSNFWELKTAFNKIYPNTNIAYSYKTNYTPKLCKIVNELEGYAEVVSEMELNLAKRIGCCTDRIVWNGPVKSVSIMEQFLLEGGTVNIDSREELEEIKRIHNCHSDILINVGIRCNYDVNDGVTSRFGFDIDSDDFKEAVSFATQTKNVKLINFQCHFAKRQIEYWRARAEGMVRIMDRLGIIPERIDIGGGMYGKMPESLRSQFATDIPDYQTYAEVAAKVFADYFADKDVMPELLIEPGTAVVGDCMKFVGTIKTIKNVRGKWIATVLGSQNNISMSGVNPPLKVVPMGGKPDEYENMDFVGYTCIEGDVLYKNFSGKAAVGDMVEISNCGSYSLVMKPPFILPNFPVLDISGDEVELVKRQENFEDIFQTFKF